jgi:hypothetical protein
MLSRFVALRILGGWGPGVQDLAAASHLGARPPLAGPARTRVTAVEPLVCSGLQKILKSQPIIFTK